MRLKINMKARLQRHARNSHAFNKKQVFSLLRKFKFISLIIVLILPVYPSFGAFGMNQETAVGNYDNSTIITAYEGDDEDQPAIFSKESGFIKPGSTLDDTRDVSGINKLIAYSVSDGDTMSSIADKFNVTISSIIWANDFTKDTVLHPGDTIRIPPVSGVVYTVSAGDTIESVATKYKVDTGKILEQNKLAASQELLIGQQIIVPGAARLSPPKVIPVIASTTSTKASKTDSKKKSIAKADTKKKAANRSYAVGYTGKGSKFAWGNCTYFVANHKNVTWHGNASAWLRNAAAAGVPTGSAAAPGAIISFQGSGYNPYYGHVGIVADVDGDDVIVKDMNYRRLNEVTIRRIPKDDPSIRGYIYSN